MSEAAWEELVTTALIGTARRGDGGPGELLDRAARLTAARRAGRLPIAAEPPGPAGPDTDQPASTAAASWLAAMLVTGRRAELMPEWLTAARARGKRPPDQLLPALLDRAIANKDLRPLIDSPRARWLARLNPERWSFPELTVAPGDDTPWRLGTRDERRAYLAAVRAADPARARQLIAEAASAAERIAFLAELEQGLSPDDEPLLEQALQDRAQEVRATAVRLLAKLPGSRLAREVAEQALLAVRYSNGTFTVSGPLDEVRTLLARAQLATWTRAWEQPPERIVAAPAGAWAPVLLTGWATAAIDQGDTPWITALLGRLLTASDPAATRLAEQLARHADPALGAITEPDEEFPPKIANVLRTLRFRHDMLKEFDD